MIRRKNKKMKIGWIVPTIGTFGAVREMIEVSNILVERGHKVFIYHPDGTPCKWLRCLAECRKLGFLRHDPLDVLIGIIDWKPELYNYLLETQARVKAICLLGFEPTEEMAQVLRGETQFRDEADKIIRDAILNKFTVLADSSWQIEWVKEKVGYMEVGPSFGGVNLKMFHPSAVAKTEDKIKIIYSGDPRERKGTDTVEKALEIIKEKNFSNLEIDSYWGKRFSQQQLVEFIQSSHIFLDGHRRAGWCNPVAEAMACGSVPICTDIGAVRDFAIHGKTALVVGVDDAVEMAAEACFLVESKMAREALVQNGIRHIQNFSYEKVVPILERSLEQKLYA